MIRFLYNLLFPLALLFFLPGYLAKMRRRGNYRENFGQRLGFYAPELRRRLARGRRTWMHAVSVGEVNVGLKLARQLHQLDPHFACALTTTTTTGYALARQEAPDWVEVIYTPLDFWPIMRRAFALLRPEKIILVEAEVWPNMMTLARRERVPVALVNARLSPRSERRFRRFRGAVAPVFRQLDLVCVPEAEDVDRWEWLGVPRERICHTGSIKYDTDGAHLDETEPRRVLDLLGVDAKRPLLLAGSTHAGEEKIVARIFERLRVEFPDLFLIIAPRHVERVPALRAELEARGLQVSLRDAPSAGDVLLINTTGELRNWYPVATVVFIGKSLTAHGGQNPVEPLIAGRPVVFGPNMENFAALTRLLLSHQAARQIADEGTLAQEIAHLLRDPAARARLVANASSVLDSHRGATAHTAALVAALPPLSRGAHPGM